MTPVPKSFPACSSGLPKSDAFARLVLLNEINSGGFEGAPDRCLIGGCNWNLPVDDLDPADRCNSNSRRSGQVKRSPSKHGASRFGQDGSTSLSRVETCAGNPRGGKKITAMWG
jgi:hypothetical protein